VKLGGHALDDLSPTSENLASLAMDILTLRANGTAVVLVHGGGPQIAALLQSVAAENAFIDGLRVTSHDTMAYVDMALAGVNRAVVAALHVHGVRAVGVSGADGGVLQGVALGAPWGQVATAIRVEPSLLHTLLADEWVPVISPVANDDNGVRLNCNADTAAGALAGALSSDGLVLLSDIDQLRADPDDPATGLATIHLADVEAMIASGAARDGMRPKLTAATDALHAGAARVWLANGTRPHVLRDLIAQQLLTTEVLL
jgi:acetylglutamate kinase